jgi:hypothetical protein
MSLGDRRNLSLNFKATARAEEEKRLNEKWNAPLTFNNGR